MTTHPDPAPVTVIHDGEEATGSSDPFAGYEKDRPRPSGRPWLVANMVAGLDGSLAWHGKVGALSSSADRSLFVRLRSVADAVVVGAGTVRAEGYGPVKLSEERRARRVAEGHLAVPPLVVVSRSLDFDWDAPLWSPDVDPRPIVVTAGSAPSDRLARAQAHSDVIVVGDEAVDLPAAMGELAARGMHQVLTEGGPTLLAELVAAGLLDELCLTITPLFGGDPLTMAHRPVAAPALSSFSLEGVVREGDELYLRYLLQREAADPEGTDR